MNIILLINVLFSFILTISGNDQQFDRYSGKEIKKQITSKGDNESKCTIKVKPCKPHEGSRVDGTCNNYKYPTRGSARGPYLRLLNTDYGHANQDIRKDRNGRDLPSARKVRTTLQTDGRVVDKHHFTTAAFHYLQFIHFDVSVLNGPMDYLMKRQYCCKPEGRLDPRCRPIPVPNDDPYLRVSDIRCLNFSRAETFQDYGCIDNTTKPEQINFQTPVIDLSTVYGVDEKSLNAVRTYKHGLLNLEYRDFRHVPLANSSRSHDPLMDLTTSTPRLILNLSTLNQPSDNIKLGKTKWIINVTKLEPVRKSDDVTVSNGTTSKRVARQVPVSLPNTGGLNNAVLTPVAGTVDAVTPTIMDVGNMTVRNETVCIQNLNNETKCYVFGFPEAGNYDLRTTTFAIFFTREHNRLAKALHKLNPCWKDDRLFKVSRQINIASASNIFMYELLPMLLGRQNMLKYGVISDYVQHITAYDEDAVPLVYAEFEIAVRYYHTLLDGRIKLYDEKYHYDGELSVGNTTFRQGLIEMDKIFEKLNRGTFYQPASKVDDIQDPEISEKYYGDLQRAADLPSLDIQRGRDLGIRGYNDYRHICGMKPAKKFEDLADVMDREKIESLKKLYVEIEDIDLLAGIMSEIMMPGTFVGPTLFCIMTKQLQLFRFADRFWFERGDQFHSLTSSQLHEVRKTNMARLACDNAEAIKFIQPRAFENVGPHNRHVPCAHIPGLDIYAWKDNSCRNDHENEYKTMFNNNGNYINVKQHFTINGVGKADKYSEQISHWFTNKVNKQNEEKHWSSNHNDGKYKEEKPRPIDEDNGQYKENYPTLIEDDGKYDDAVDWPVKKHTKHQNQWESGQNNHWTDRHYSGQPYASTSHHRTYHSDGTNFSPFFQSIFS